MRDDAGNVVELLTRLTTIDPPLNRLERAPVLVGEGSNELAHGSG
jgi:hypothetical protein